MKNSLLNERFCRVLEGLEGTLGELEEQRKRELPKVMVIVILFASFFCSLAFFLTYPIIRQLPSNQITQLGVIFIVITCIVIFIGTAHFLLSANGQTQIRKYILGDYVSSFKYEVIEKIFSLLGSNVFYAPNRSIPTEQFYESLLFGENLVLGRLNGDDFTQVQIGKTEITFSELHLSVGSGEDSINIFDGLFFVADIKKSFNIPVGTRTTVGKQQIKTDNPKFNKYFKIYSDDRISVFEALSNSFLEKLIEFKNNNDINLDFSFVGNKAYFAIHYPSEMTLFEPPIWKTLFNPDIYENFLLDIQLIYDLIETLELEK